MVRKNLNLKIKVTSRYRDEIAAIDTVPSRLSWALQKATEDGVSAIRQVALERIPKRTGRTASTVSSETNLLGPNTIRGRVYTDDPVGSFQEFGTITHDIPARRTRFLRFVIDGRVIYTRLVKDHPGPTPRFWLRKSVEIADPVIRIAYDRHVSRVL